MKLLKSNALLGVFVACLATLSLSAQKNLGMGKMWTLENPPLEYLEKEYGFKPDQKWLNSLRMASIRFGGGCSSSFVSPKGLIMTNHHCARGHIARVSGDKEWDKNGFYARSLDDEVKLPDLTVQQLMATEDVTAKMNAGIEDGDTDAAIDKKRQANRKDILADFASKHPGLRHEVVILFQGAVYQVYSYKIWSDIRLVCSPHMQVAFFGGDPDNFTYPRWCIDFTFCRAYEDGKPADTSKHYFKWSMTGAKPGELVFTTGNPGSTSRLLTKAQMDQQRDTTFPLNLDRLDVAVATLKKLRAADPEYERETRTMFFGAQNSQKALHGYYSGLTDEKLMAQKAAADEEFRNRVHNDPALKAKYGDAWTKLEEIAAEQRALQPKLELQRDYNSPVLSRALIVVAALNPSSSDPDKARKAAANARKAALEPMGEKQRFSDALFAAHLERGRKWLGKDDPYVKVAIGDLSGAEAVARINQSRVSDDAFVRKVLDAGAEKLGSWNDIALNIARVLLPLRRANLEKNSDIAARTRVQGTRIGQALFAVYGNRVSPDATFTLRFSDGLVKGYPYNGTIAPPTTSFYGMFGHAADFDSKPPFNLPKIWMDKRDKIDMTKPVNFVSSNDIIGGNSGSPVVNKNLEVVGLIFDGNIEMLPNNFVYTDAVPRAVSVHVSGIMEALKVYDATRVIEELSKQ